MTKITITIPPSLLPYFQHIARQYLLDPAACMKYPTVTKLVVLEWVLAKIQKLHPTNPKANLKFRAKYSEALALQEGLIKLNITDTLADIDRNQLIDDIARQFPPHLLNTSPV